MRHNAIGRLAVIALSGTFIFAAVPAFAACSGDNCTGSDSSVSVKKHSKKIHVAHRRHYDDDDIASIGRRQPDADTAKSAAKIDARANGASADALPAEVADARAQMTADDAKAKPAADAPIQANPDPAAGAQDPVVQVVNADELNDVDKTATDGIDLPKLSSAVANSHAEMRDDRASPWAQTSTIGKAFIAFGVMLTLASAARMFMA